MGYYIYALVSLINKDDLKKLTTDLLVIVKKNGSKRKGTLKRKEIVADES